MLTRTTSLPARTAPCGLRNITAGPDGDPWFTEAVANKIGWITTGGSITEYPIPTGNAAPRGLVRSLEALLAASQTYAL